MEKKLSATELSQQSPFRLIEGSRSACFRTCWYAPQAYWTQRSEWCNSPTGKSGDSSPRPPRRVVNTVDVSFVQLDIVMTNHINSNYFCIWELPVLGEGQYTKKTVQPIICHHLPSSGCVQSSTFKVQRDKNNRVGLRLQIFRFQGACYVIIHMFALFVQASRRPRPSLGKRKNKEEVGY